jgi:hypothetical protein
VAGSNRVLSLKAKLETVWRHPVRLAAQWAVEKLLLKLGRQRRELRFGHP